MAPVSVGPIHPPVLIESFVATEATEGGTTSKGTKPMAVLILALLVFLAFMLWVDSFTDNDLDGPSSGGTGI